MTESTDELGPVDYLVVEFPGSNFTSTAGLLIYENLWAAPFASAVRRAGGQLVASGRIPTQQLLAVLEDDLAEEAG